MCARVYVSPLLLLTVNENSIVPSARTITCACPFESDVLAPFGSFSARSVTLNTVGGAASSVSPNDGAGTWLELMFVGVASAHAATARTAQTWPQRIRPPGCWWACVMRNSDVTAHLGVWLGGVAAASPAWRRPAGALPSRRPRAASPALPPAESAPPDRRGSAR